MRQVSTGTVPSEVGPSTCCAYVFASTHGGHYESIIAALPVRAAPVRRIQAVRTCIHPVAQAHPQERQMQWHLQKQEICIKILLMYTPPLLQSFCWRRFLVFSLY
eukprot:GHVU01134131.1.p1 GENE.GHVU01134131.1~~GHVU01134131.1.p1  ORF type:complete len:105 (-),score=3.56 GHVU01134131.1:336-650(-)